MENESSVSSSKNDRRLYKTEKNIADHIYYLLAMSTFYVLPKTAEEELDAYIPEKRYYLDVDGQPYMILCKLNGYSDFITHKNWYHKFFRLWSRMAKIRHINTTGDFRFGLLNYDWAWGFWDLDSNFGYKEHHEKQKEQQWKTFTSLCKKITTDKEPEFDDMKWDLDLSFSISFSSLKEQVQQARINAMMKNKKDADKFFTERANVAKQLETRYGYQLPHIERRRRDDVKELDTRSISDQYVRATKGRDFWAKKVCRNKFYANHV